MTDGSGAFVALTSCRDQERVEEFLTWYAEVRFVMLSPWRAATQRRSIDVWNLASRHFWLSTRWPATPQTQRPDFGRLSKTATPRATSASFWRFAWLERSRSRNG